ncbi:KIF1-binding protein, partial [Galemys pyrenaicus]
EPFWPMIRAWPEIHEKFQAALALSRLNWHKNPKKEPYQSKHSARAPLKEMQALKSSAPEEEERLQYQPHLGLWPKWWKPRGIFAQEAVRMEVIQFYLGASHIDTKEFSALEELLHTIASLHPDKSKLHKLTKKHQYPYVKDIEDPPLDSTEHFFLKKKNLLNKRDQRDLGRFILIHILPGSILPAMEMFEKATHKSSCRLMVIALTVLKLSKTIELCIRYLLSLKLTWKFWAKCIKSGTAMLEPLIVDPNPQCYLLVNRQIQFEIAHMYYDMMNLKFAVADKLRDSDSHILKIIILITKMQVAISGKIITADAKKELENL